jgi:hypothetical protein
MKWIKAHFAWFVPLATLAVSFLTPSVAALVAAHPQYATTLGAAWGVLAALTKSPIGNQGSKF